jgi:hypothetical protein
MADPTRPTQLLLSMLVLSAVPIAAQAQWTVVNLHPTGSSESRALAVRDGQQVGYATVVSAGGWASIHAALWSGSAASYVHLDGRPQGTGYSIAHGVHGGQQVGEFYTLGPGQFKRATLWSGSALSRVELHPPGSIASEVRCMSAQHQAGSADFGGQGQFHAGIWSGTAASWVDLHPAASGATASAVFGTSDGVHVGGAVIGGTVHASLWGGTTASWVDLHPPGASDSMANTVHAGQQGGYATVLGVRRASLWTGNAASWIDLHPIGASASEIKSIYSGNQVGSVTLGHSRASLWRGSAASWEDLSLVLPGSWGNSSATGVWEDSTTTYVVGYGMNLNVSPAREHALLWMRPILPQPCYPNCDNSTTAPILNIDDFTCFINTYAAATALTHAQQLTHYANCDGSTVTPAINVDDFTCFINRFAAGCP